MTTQFMIIFAALMLLPMAAGLPKDGFRFAMTYIGFAGLGVCTFIQALEHL